MTTAYTLIQSIILTGPTTTVSFTGIPDTYKDLSLWVSARSNYSATIGAFLLQVNGVGSGIYYYERFLGNGGSSSTAFIGSQPQMLANYLNAGTSTANTFGNAEFYFFNYTSNEYKNIKYFGVQENNGSDAYMANTIGLFRDTGQISSISISSNFNSFIAGSSFYLYGIKNS